MKKIAKLSLVAAVAVAGLTTANAQPLEEAIKNVDVSGSVVYRYDNFNNDEAANSATERNNYKVGLNAAAKVNEDVKFNSRFLVANSNGDFASRNTTAGLNSDDESDVNPGVTLSHAYFAYTGVSNTTVNVGKQGLATPWTVALDSDGNEQTGTGILALSTMGPVTAAGGFFNQTNLDASGNINSGQSYTVANVTGTALTNNENMGSRDVFVGALLADLSPVKLEAWYLDLADTFDTYTLVAKAGFDVNSDSKIGAEARYVSLDLDNADSDNAMYRLAVTGNVSIVNAKVSYTKTDKDGGLTALDQDAENASLGWNLTSNGVADAKYWQGVLGVNILSNLNLSANYGNLDSDEDEIEAEELFAQLTYKMSKNLSTYLRYGTYEEDDTGANTTVSDQNRGRLQVEYTF